MKREARRIMCEFTRLIIQRRVAASDVGSRFVEWISNRRSIGDTEGRGVGNAALTFRVFR